MILENLYIENIPVNDVTRTSGDDHVKQMTTRLFTNDCCGNESTFKKQIILRMDK